MGVTRLLVRVLVVTGMAGAGLVGGCGPGDDCACGPFFDAGCQGQVRLFSPCSFRSIHTDCFSGSILCTDTAGGQLCPVTVAGAGTCTISAVLGDGTKEQLTVSSSGSGTSCFQVTGLSGSPDFSTPTCMSPGIDAAVACTYDVMVSDGVRQCAVAGDCAILDHVRDCAGSVTYMGLSSMYLPYYQQSEQTEQMACVNRKCSPPPLPGLADDGTTAPYPASVPNVLCVVGDAGGGLCTTSFGEAGAGDGGADAPTD